jgi:MoxR-like ATPase
VADAQLQEEPVDTTDDELSLNDEEQRDETFKIADNFPEKGRVSLSRMRRLRTELNTLNPERDMLVDLIICAAIGCQVILLKGAAGVGKTRIGEMFFNSIADATVFTVQFFNTMTAEFLFGPIDLKKMEEQGRIEYVIEKMLPDCDYAMLDEIFDGNKGTLRSMLGTIHPHKRVFRNGRQVVNVPLKSAIATTNFGREDEEELDALRDRFAAIYEVQPITEFDNKVQVILNEHRVPETQITKKTLNNLNVISRKVIVTDECVSRLIEIHDKLEAKGIKTSLRRVRSAVELMRAHAVLNGRVSIRPEDYVMARFCLTETASQVDVWNIVADPIINRRAENRMNVKGAVERGKVNNVLGDLRKRLDAAYSAGNVPECRAVAKDASKAKINVERQIHDGNKDPEVRKLCDAFGDLAMSATEAVTKLRNA